MRTTGIQKLYLLSGHGATSKKNVWKAIDAAGLNSNIGKEPKKHQFQDIGKEPRKHQLQNIGKEPKKHQPQMTTNVSLRRLKLKENNLVFLPSLLPNLFQPMENRNDATPRVVVPQPPAT